MQRRNNPNQRKEKNPDGSIEAVLTKSPFLLKQLNLQASVCSLREQVYPFGLPLFSRASLFPNSGSSASEILALRHQLLRFARSSRWS